MVNGIVVILDRNIRSVDCGIERILVRGSAAEQCGKASPFRPVSFTMVAKPPVKAENDASYFTRQPLLLPHFG